MPNSGHGPVLAIGGFDGVHLGHQQIIGKAKALAEKQKARAEVLTFDPLPAQLIHPDFTYVLTPLEEKAELLVELGIDVVRVVRFDAATRLESPVRFVSEHLLTLNPSAVVVGHDHRFGRGRDGDIGLLRRLLESRGVELEIVPEFLLLGVPVRSTRVREHLLMGHVRLAAELLGRDYAIAGRVISGTSTGRELGYPTINLQLEEPEKLVPADGVYAVRVDIEGSTRPAVLNIGHRPTFSGEKRSIEAHLFDCVLCQSPETAAVRFIQRLRPERKFPDPKSLSDQIGDDIVQARGLLAG